jgi:hypothetical protein
MYFPKKALAVLVAGTLAGFAGSVAAHGIKPHNSPAAAPVQPAAIQLAPLVIGQTSAIQLDVVQLQRLQPNQSLQLKLGELGSLPLVFEHATAEVNGISYWEAHLDGDLQQRVSLKIDHGAVSGSIQMRFPVADAVHFSRRMLKNQRQAAELTQLQLQRLIRLQPLQLHHIELNRAGLADDQRRQLDSRRLNRRGSGAVMRLDAMRGHTTGKSGQRAGYQHRQRFFREVHDDFSVSG